MGEGLIRNAISDDLDALVDISIERFPERVKEVSEDLIGAPSAAITSAFTYRGTPRVIGATSRMEL